MAQAPNDDLAKLDAEFERITWYLWHGNVFCALQEIEGVQWDLEDCEEAVPASTKLAKSVREFRGYIEANQHFIPNYGERYRYGEAIATGFVESTVNQVVSKRMVKKQQMRWTKRGAHLLLQVRAGAQRRPAGNLRALVSGDSQSKRSTSGGGVAPTLKWSLWHRDILSLL